MTEPRFFCIKKCRANHIIGMKREEDQEGEDVVCATEMTGMVPVLPTTEEEKTALSALSRKPKGK